MIVDMIVYLTAGFWDLVGKERHSVDIKSGAPA